MGNDDKIRNAADRTEGRLKEATGALTDDDELRAEGKGQQSESDLKDAAEKAKDAVNKVGDALRK